MLQLILGRAGSGKTYRIREQSKTVWTEQNTEKIMLLVPETIFV